MTERKTMNTLMITADDARKNMAHLPYLVDIVNDAISSYSKSGKQGFVMNLYTGSVPKVDLMRSFTERGFEVCMAALDSESVEIRVSWANLPPK